MTKDVLVSIFGIRQSDEEEQIEAVTKGKYSIRNGIHYVSCELQQPEEMGGNIKYLFKFTEDRLEIIQRGFVKATMIFVPGEINFSSYRTPVGELTLGIYTEKLYYSETGGEISAEVIYKTEINDEQYADNKICIKIKAIN